jgi:hypothetical protein
MRFKIIILSFLLLPAAKVISQPFDCSKFKEGKFRITDTRAGVVTIAERKGNYQTESSEALKVVLRFRITWQGNCTYTLRLDKVIRNENKIDFPYNMVVHVKIIETAGKSYTQEISSSLTNDTYKVEVTRID